MLKYRNHILILILAILLFSIFFVKSSNIQVDKSIIHYNIKCQNCIAFQDTVLSFSNTFKIKVSAVGYQSETFELSHKDGFNLVTLRPNDITVQFVYDTSPENVKLFINDSTKNFSDKVSFAPGDYKIKITSDNYFTFEKVISLKATDKKLDIDLTNNLISKNIEFITTKKNAYKLNGVNNISNEDIYTLRKKSNIITYEKKNSIYEYEFNVVNNNSETINLDDIFSGQSFGVLIETFPSGAAVRVNDTYKGLSPVTINEGEIRKLEISAVGYEDYISKGNSIGEENNIFIELKPILTHVTIDSQPQSSIYINNKYISLTPKSLKLPVGQHSLSLVKEGYVTIEKKINIENNIKLNFDEVLLTYKQHALTTSPNLFKSENGIELILMSPGEIQLGSPENEKRRSRNEIQKNIKISKHFYASKNLISEKIFNSVMGYSSSSSMFPKVEIEWNEAAIFANKLSELEGFNKFYEVDDNKVIGININSRGYRMLSEAEWELCASENYIKSIYPWGNVELIPPLAGNLAGEENIGKLKFYIKNYRDEYVKRSKVGSFKENANGFTDIVGNVSEWVNDFYTEDFLTATNDLFVDYLGPLFGNSHVVKGSNYETSNQTELGISYRAGVIGPSELIGFRVARWIY